MGEVVQQHHLSAAVGAGELAAGLAVADGDRQRRLRRRARAARHTDPALHQGAQHREEPPVGVVDGAGVGAVRGHVTVPVEQRGARHPDVVEPQAAVVHAVQPRLGAAVLDAHPRYRPPRPVADRYQQRVHAVPLPTRDELREHHRQLAVAGGVADVVLAGGLVGGVHHELVGVRVERRGGAQPLHVRAVPRLGHREAPGDLQRHHPRQVGGVVPFGAQRLDRPAEQAPLHTHLHHQRQVADQHLEGDHGTADVTGAAVGGREPVAGEVRLGEPAHLLTHPGAVLLHPQSVPGRELGAAQQFPGASAHLGPPAVQQFAQGLGIDRRRIVTL